MNLQDQKFQDFIAADHTKNIVEIYGIDNVFQWFKNGYESRQDSDLLHLHSAEGVCYQAGYRAIVKEISDKFSREINDILTAEELEEINQLNSEDNNPRICHTHSHCDANIYMYVGWNEAGFVPDEYGTKVWNDAWELSKKNKFKI